MTKKFILGLVVYFLLSVGTNAWAQTQYLLDTGDPAERVCNPRSYTDLGNGIVRDNVTGLEWVQDNNLITSRDPSFDNDDTAGDGRVAWQHAIDYIALLNAEQYLGYDDWRLPSIKELITLMDYSLNRPPLDPLSAAERGLLLDVYYLRIQQQRGVARRFLRRSGYDPR